jgi:multidrug efflux pump subunit AcrA (membrane-fusion protein)
MVVSATIHDPTTRHTIQIPVSAVCSAYGQPPYVMLVEPKLHTVISRSVQLGSLVGDRVEVTQGLSAGELLVVGGQDRVIAGDIVQSKPAAPASIARTDQMPP